MRDIGKPAIAATVGATVLAVALGFVLAGTSYVAGALPGVLCHSHDSLFCRVAEAWHVYWWFVYALLWWPIWAVLFVILIRRFVKAGMRLAAGGLVLMVAGCFSVVVNVVSLANGEWSESMITGISWLVIDAVMLLFGMKLYYYRAAA